MLVLRDYYLYGEKSSHVVMDRAYTFNAAEFKQHFQHLDVLEFHGYNLYQVPFAMMDIADKVIFYQCELANTEDDLMLMCIHNCMRTQPLELAFIDCTHVNQAVNYGNLCVLWRCLSGLTVHDQSTNITDGFDCLCDFLPLMLSLTRLELKNVTEDLDALVYNVAVSNLKELRLTGCRLSPRNLRELREGVQRKDGLVFTCE